MKSCKVAINFNYHKVTTSSLIFTRVRVHSLKDLIKWWAEMNGRERWPKHVVDLRSRLLVVEEKLVPIFEIFRGGLKRVSVYQSSGHHQEKSSKDLSNWQVAVMLLLLKTYSLKILMSKVFLLWIGWIDLDWLMFDMDWLIWFWFWLLFETFVSKMNFENCWLKPQGF